MKKKLLFILLLAIMIVTTFVTNVFAENEPKSVGTSFTVDDINYKVTSIGTPNTVEVSTNTYYQNSDLNIPSTINDENGVSYTVTRIGIQAFRYNDNFSSVTLPNTILSIGEEAFECCDGFSEITIPDSVTIIETAAFQQCMNLATVNISSSSNLETISDRAFMSSEAIHSLTIPASVTSIGESPFYGLSLEISFLGTTPPTLSHPLNYKTFNWCTISNIYVPTDALATYRLALKEEGSYYFFENKVQKVPSTSDVAISELLPDDFPDRNDLLRWQNSNEASLSIDEYGFLWFDKGELNDRPFVICESLMASLIADGNYSYSDAALNSKDAYTFTFVMNEGNLASITVEGFTNDYAVFNGSYQMQDYPTVEELLNKAENGFPTSVDDSWVDENYFEGLFVYTSGGYLKLYDSLNDTTTSLVSLSESTSINDNYFMVSTSIGKDMYFLLYGNKLYELAFYEGEEGGPFIYPPQESTTLSELFGGLTAPFPTSIDDAYTDYVKYYSYIDNDKLVVSDGSQIIDSINLSKIVPSSSYIYFMTKSEGCFYICLNDELNTIQYIEYYVNEPYLDTYLYPYSELMALLYTNYPSGLLPWVNESGKYFYLDESYLVFADFDNEKYDSAYDSAYEMALTSGNNKYIATTRSYELSNPLTLTFNVDEDGKFISLTVEGYNGGDYDFFDGTYYPPLTIKDIIANDFPIYDDYGPTSAWENEAGTKLYGLTWEENEKYLVFENDDYIVECYPPTAYIGLTEESTNVYMAGVEAHEINNEIYGYAVLTCNTNDNDKLISITVEFSDEFSDCSSVLNGTYESSITIASILPSYFPTTITSGWVDNDESYKMFHDNNYLKVYMNPSVTITLSDSTALTKDGNNYTYTLTESPNYTLVFKMDGNNLQAVDVTEAGTTYYTFEPYKYTTVPAPKPEGYAGDLAFITNAKYTDDNDVTVKVNGTKLTIDKEYTLSSGSTHVTLKGDYVKTLNAGTYTITIGVTGYDNIDSTFTITGSTPIPTPAPTPSSHDDRPIPSTGVEAYDNTLLKVTSLSLSLLAATTYIIIKKKDNN